MRCCLFIFLFLFFSQMIHGQLKDSLIAILTYEHNTYYNKSKVQKGDTTNGILYIKQKKKIDTLAYNQTPNYFYFDCLGDVDYFLCAQLYRSVSKTKECMVDYITFKCSNRFQVIYNGILYEAGYANVFSDFKPRLLKGLRFSYRYTNNKKYLTLIVLKPIQLELASSGYALHQIMEKENLTFKQAQKRYPPIQLLPSSTLEIYTNLVGP